MTDSVISNYQPPTKKPLFDDEIDEPQPLLEIDGELYDQRIAVEKGIFLARMLETGGLYEEMGEQIFDTIRAKDVQQVRFEKKGPAQDADYTKRERDTIAVGLRNMIAQRRMCLRQLVAIKDNPKYTRYTKAQEVFIVKIKDEVNRICQAVIDINSTYTVDRKANGLESQVFFNKLLADFKRYQSEVQLSNAKSKELNTAADF